MRGNREFGGMGGNVGDGLGMEIGGEIGNFGVLGVGIAGGRCGNGGFVGVSWEFLGGVGNWRDLGGNPEDLGSPNPRGGRGIRPLSPPPLSHRPLSPPPAPPPPPLSAPSPAPPRPEHCEGAAAVFRGAPPAAPEPPEPPGGGGEDAVGAARAALLQKLLWAARELPRTGSAEASAHLCHLIRACADALGGLQALEPPRGTAPDPPAP